VGIYELVYLTPDMQRLVLQRAAAVELRDLATKQGFRSLRQDGWIKAWQGVTSIEEVLRVTETGAMD
jgi:general secretion pathway protein E